MAAQPDGPNANPFTITVPASPSATAGSSTAGPKIRPKFLTVLIVLPLFLVVLLTILGVKLVRRHQEARNVRSLVELRERTWRERQERKERAQQLAEEEEAVKKARAEGDVIGKVVDEEKLVRERDASGSIGWGDWVSPKKGG